jgi:hypothetical protein
MRQFLLRFFTACLVALAAGMVLGQAAAEVEQWGIFEISLKGPTTGNPFLEVNLSARFTQGDQTVEVTGFYDGDGNYRIRFMPEKLGEWRYVTKSNRAELNGKSGAFTCGKPSANNHGPVRVRNTYHFAYADGIPYFQVGTTSYAWTHQGDQLEEQTLATLKTAPFNKMRMCVFPKHYLYNANEPVYHAFEKTETGEFNFTRFNPEFFRHFEKRVGDLRELGIEADIIIFHPYDRWTYAIMGAENDDRYLRYLVARLSAYRNVWWSLANEFDFMMDENRGEMKNLKERGKQLKLKTTADWDRFFQILQKEDPHQHLRSIHNGRVYYDHVKPWVTHASIQNGYALEEVGGAGVFRMLYRKPVVFDEARYEGNIARTWGNIPAQEMVHKFWLGTIAGTYVGHGETYLHPQDILWWAKGGVLHGQSPARIAFLKKILESAPAEGLEPVPHRWARRRGAGKEGEYYLFYFGYDEPNKWSFELPADAKFQAELIDTWEMTITPLQGTFSGKFELPLPGKPYLAVRLRKLQ